jgi:hypothetical protein
MEIYTTDFIDIAQKYANNIEKKLGTINYVIEDECCNKKQDNDLYKAFEYKSDAWFCNYCGGLVSWKKNFLKS